MKFDHIVDIVCKTIPRVFTYEYIGADFEQTGISLFNAEIF